jgi:hypothetical protein
MSPSTNCQQSCPEVALSAITRQADLLRGTSIFLLTLTAILSGTTHRSARALTFQLTVDNSASSAPAGFLPAFNGAIQFYQTTFTDPITIKLQVGWGTIDNHSMSPGALGQSLVNGQVSSNFAGVKSALVSDAKSGSGQTSVASSHLCRIRQLPWWMAQRSRTRRGTHFRFGCNNPRAATTEASGSREEL